MGLYGLLSPLKSFATRQWLTALVADLAAIDAGPPRAQVYRAVDQSIDDSDFTQIIAFDTVLYDTDNFWSAGHPARLTAPFDGLYRVTAEVKWDSVAAGQRWISLIKNATDGFATVTQQSAGASLATEMQVIKDVLLQAGDYVNVFVFQNSGGAIDVQTVGAAAPAMSMCKIG